MMRTPDLVAWHRTGTVRAAVLILPGGVVSSRGRYLKVFDVLLRRLARRLARHGEPSGLAVYLLRYRYRGWNASDDGRGADTATDARWALDRLAERHGDVPVALVGNSLGGAAAFRVAGHRLVTSVVGLAPWLPGGDPVSDLAGRKVLIIHGDRDLRAAPAPQSLTYAQRLRAVVPDLARLEVVGGRHALIRRSGDCWAAITNFVLGTLGAARLAPALTEAMAAPVPNGLRLPLPVGFAA